MHTVRAGLFQRRGFPDPEGPPVGDPEEGPVEDPRGWSIGNPEEGPARNPEGWSTGDPEEGPVEDPKDDFFDGRTGPPFVRRFSGPMGQPWQRPGRFGKHFGTEPWEDVEDTHMGDRLTGMERRLDNGVRYWLRLLQQLCASYWGLAEVEDAGEVEEMKLAAECERWLTGDAAWGNGGPSLDMMQLIFSNKRLVDKLREMTDEME